MQQKQLQTVYNHGPTTPVKLQELGSHNAARTQIKRVTAKSCDCNSRHVLHNSGLRILNDMKCFSISLL